jgi:ferritin-like protein
MTEYHESTDALPEEAKDFHRALKSLCEELEAVDWYHQRVSTTQDVELRQLLIHNRDEEIEHSCMLLEWLRRKMPGWDSQMQTYLFKDSGIVELEESGTGGQDTKEAQPNGKSGGTMPGDLNLRDLRKESD